MSSNFSAIDHHYLRMPGVDVDTNGVVVCSSGGPVVFGGVGGVDVGPGGGAVVSGGGTNGVVVFSSGGPVVPGAAVVTGPAVVRRFPVVVISTEQPNFVTIKMG
jgi:hypothetical protein